MDREDKVVLFSPETFNLAETTRCLEVAKKMPSTITCIFSGYSEKYARLIEEAGFDFHFLSPKMSENEIQAVMKFDQGKSFRNPFSTLIIRQRVSEEIQLIRKQQVSTVVIGSTLSMLISARVCHIHSVYIKPYAYSKAHIVQMKTHSKKIHTKILGHMLLKINYIPKSFRQVSKEYKVHPFKRTIDLMEADYNLITTLPEILEETKIPENYRIVGPIYANIREDFFMKKTIERVIKNAQAENSPILYFAMGSSSNKKTILTILTSLKDLPVTVIAPVKVYLTEDEIQQFQQTNIHIFDWLPSVEIGKSIDLSVIHGGEGTIQTACLTGKPFIGIGLQLEQKANLNAFQLFGNAKVLKNLQKRTIRLAVEEILTDPSFMKKAVIMKKYMEKANGPEMAARFITKLCKKPYKEECIPKR